MIQLRQPWVLWTVIALTATLPLNMAAAADYTIALPASWVAPIAISDYEVPTKEVSYGAYWLVLDRQTHIAASGSEVYHASAIKLLNESGVDEHSQISIDFDPSYQTLVLHKASLIRDGQTIDQLGRAKLSVLQRETALEYRIYDGSKTLNLIFEDVRVGDVITYSYTLHGRNPVFGNFFFDSVQTQWNEPVAYQRLRIVHEKDRPLQYRALNEMAVPQITRGRDETELLWVWKNVPALLYESDIPRWYTHYPFIQFSDARSWEDVNNWARKLFEPKPQSGIEWRNRLTALAEDNRSDSDRLRATLKFAQQNIRYMGIEIGRASHQPTDPETVLKRRFGDCKDKALLTVSLLSAMGIKAVPVLVSTSDGQTLDRMLPSAGIFNHVIVRAQLEGREYWIDPTRTGQQGRLDALHQPDFGFVLPVTAGSENLVRMPREKSDTPLRRTYDLFDLSAGIDKPGTLTVTSTFYDHEADAMRQRLAVNSRASIEKEYLDYYAGQHDDITQEAPLETRDDIEQNSYETVERYKIATPFRKDEQGVLRFGVRGYTLDDLLYEPATKIRTAPFSIPYPLNTQHHIEVLLPEPWPITYQKTTAQNPAFDFSVERSYSDRKMVLDFQLRSFADHLSSDNVRQYLDDLEKMNKELGYELTYDANAKRLHNISSAYFIAVLLALALSVPAGVVLYKYSPAPKVEAVIPPDWPQGIRGWLVLPAFSAIVIPISYAAAVWVLATYLTSENWENLPALAVSWARDIVRPLFLLLPAATVILLTLSVVHCVLFFKKRSSVRRIFPLLIWATSFWGAAVTFIPQLCPTLVEELKGSDYGDIARDFIFAMIWTAYFLISRRVQATFVNPYPSRKSDPSRQPAQLAPT